ncbi:AraC family transcriptional regulator [Pontivivens insulae]|uniref:RCS-specific HTH-type transcriptional activator RclR n=1 Tax=Pontivivens insulae TaxID=1639689 RepID=A0A2R8A934_9RHOB|nr:AraC family transcriptional regulator [Pontivivens insulae]RED18841.1 AraC family transcriptional regulator [Pontivivens insulae]SPF28741.1 RCS-specific HTH-type transcriptional activator RclR [Pontivivens insulae]
MSLERLKQLSTELLAKEIEASGRALPSAHIFQRTEITVFEAVVYNPVICLILQGRKEMSVGRQIVDLTDGQMLLVSHDLPVVSKITQASAARPYRALIFSLDLSILRGLYEQVGEAASNDAHATSLSASPADPAWTEPMVRYLELMNAPMDAQVLGPMILREIHYRLLLSPIGGMLRNLLSVDSHASRIAKSIQRIRANFREPLIVGDLAQVAGMSSSSFHQHFKSVTGTTPLQYQKDLRMIEARSLLERGVPSVSYAGFEVGYESPTQFSRDYARKFGCSPKHHLARAS